MDWRHAYRSWRVLLLTCSTKAAFVGGRYSYVRNDWANICWRAWLTAVRVQETEYNEMTKLSITAMSSEGVTGLSIRWQNMVVSSGRVLNFAWADFFPVPEKKDVLSDLVRAWNARRAFALSCRYTVRCNRADIAVSVSWYNDIEPWALHGLSHATCHSDWCQRAGYMPTLYKIRGFTQTDSAITLYTRKLWHRRYFLNREVPYWLQSSITVSAFRGLLLIL